MGEEGAAQSVQLARIEDAEAAAVLLDAFNTEFDCPTPGVPFLAERLRVLLGAHDAYVLLAGEGREGIVVMRVRPALWSTGNDAYIEEVYVVPQRRRQGIGRALVTGALALARELGCGRVELGTDEGDAEAHRLYEEVGFTNFANERTRERMLFYEREL